MEKIINRNTLSPGDFLSQVKSCGVRQKQNNNSYLLASAFPQQSHPPQGSWSSSPNHYHPSLTHDPATPTDFASQHQSLTQLDK